MSTDADLVAAVPEEYRDRMQAHLDMIRATRVAHGYPADPPTPLTMAEMKTGQIRNAREITRETIERFGGTHSCDDGVDIWHDVEGGRVTHNRDLPHFAIQTILAGCWTQDEARVLAMMAWSMPEWPGQQPAQQWRMTFNAIGDLPLCTLTETDEGCDAHDGDVTVYRGSFAAHKRGLAWTLDRERAEWFVARGDMSGRGRVMRLWTTTVPHHRILAHFTGRGENEIVADVRGLTITPIHTTGDPR